VYGIATKQGIPYDEIEDIMLEAFTRYLETYPVTKPDDEIRRLITKIAVNLCKDYYRAKMKHPTDYRDPEMMEQEVFLTGKVSENNTEDAAMEHLLEQDIIEGIRRLKPIYYQIFVLHGIQDRSTAEISEMLGITKENCRERWHRAREELAAYLEEHSGVFIQHHKKKKKPARDTSNKEESLGWE
jgi:RNA polymerase sigma-70 factor (ECF subfamily)